MKQNISFIMSNYTLSKCECISLSCGWALKYSPWMGCWGVTYCTLCMSQGPQNIMFEKGNHGNRFHSFKGPNLSASRCPATSCLLLPGAALELIRAGFSNQPCGKAWLPNHTIDQVFSVFCCHTRCQFHLIFMSVVSFWQTWSCLSLLPKLISQAAENDPR